MLDLSLRVEVVCSDLGTPIRWEKRCSYPRRFALDTGLEGYQKLGDGLQALSQHDRSHIVSGNRTKTHQ